MFLFKSQKDKARESGKESLRLAQKVYDYRRDILPENQVEQLKSQIEHFKDLLKTKTTTPDQFEKAESELEPLLKKTGGSFYPKTFWADNVEVLLVAAILAIGIRSFFFQPFKIPTNSMYPTFNGMTAEVYEPGESVSFFGKTINFLALGGKHYELIAPKSGEILFSTETEIVPARKWFILPTQKIRYQFIVGGEQVTFDVPLEFDISWVLRNYLTEESRLIQTPSGDRYYRTGYQAEAGEAFLRFDLLTGDQLFVDRIRYHFVRPKVGDSIVFRTQEIEHMDRANRGKYYIKRAVAGPGDVLEIKPPALFLNGEPILGSKAFAKNAAQIENYPGYVYGRSTQGHPVPQASGERPIEIPEDYYFAMGDNSPYSADSRMWGFVPQREIIGTSLFIYYPFSHRWGPTD